MKSLLARSRPSGPIGSLSLPVVAVVLPVHLVPNATHLLLELAQELGLFLLVQGAEVLLADLQGAALGLRLTEGTLVHGVWRLLLLVLENVWLLGLAAAEELAEVVRERLLS